MKKLFAVTTTAAFVLTAAGSPALAQEDRTAIGDLVRFDRNGDGLGEFKSSGEGCAKGRGDHRLEQHGPGRAGAVRRRS